MTVLSNGPSILFNDIQNSKFTRSIYIPSPKIIHSSLFRRFTSSIPPKFILLSAEYCILLLCILHLSQLFISCVEGYGRPVVVQVDSRHYFDELDPSSHSGRQFIPININGHRLICGDVASGATRLLGSQDDDKLMNPENGVELESVLTLPRLTALPAGPGRYWNLPEYNWTPESQMMRYLMASKMSYLMEQCFLYKSSSENYWVFDICLG